MHTQLAEFASTPAGYISGLVLPIFAGLFGIYLTIMAGRRDKRATANEARMERIESALEVQSRALELAIARASDLKADVDHIGTTTDRLSTATADLRTMLQSHIDVAAVQLGMLNDRLTRNEQKGDKQ